MEKCFLLRVSKGAIVRHPGAQPRSGNKMRPLAVVLLIALLLLYSAIATGLRINGTPSFPLGFYFAIRKRPEKGDLVFVAPPPLPLFTLAKERGYFNVAYSPTTHLVKRLVAIAGDRVTIDSAGVEVNGIRRVNSAPRNHDGADRPLRPYVLKDHILVPDEVLLIRITILHLSTPAISARCKPPQSNPLLNHC
jgi:conjugative transfer signal peptidase TraF